MARKKQDIPEETPHDSQTDLNDMVESVIQAEVASSEDIGGTKQEDSIDKLLAGSAKMVIETCMDIRRGENVLIVCDPTTGEIGQALHAATIEKSASKAIVCNGIETPRSKKDPSYNRLRVLACRTSANVMGRPVVW